MAGIFIDRLWMKGYNDRCEMRVGINKGAMALFIPYLFQRRLRLMKKNLIILYAIMIVVTSTIKLEASEQEFSNIAQISSATVLVKKSVTFITKDSKNPVVNVEVAVSTGTGFIVSEAGYILTCAHVIDKGIGSLQVQIGNSPWQEADVVRVDQDYDVAILRLRTIPLNLPIK